MGSSASRFLEIGLACLEPPVQRSDSRCPGVELTYSKLSVQPP